MRKTVVLVTLIVSALVTGAFAAIDTIAVDVGISVFKTIPLGVIPFEEKKGITWEEEKPHQIVTRDANLSGRLMSSLRTSSIWRCSAGTMPNTM